MILHHTAHVGSLSRLGLVLLAGSLMTHAGSAATHGKAVNSTPPDRATGAVLGPELKLALATAGSPAALPVIVELKDQVDLGRFNHGRASAGELIVALQETARTSQGALRDFLATCGVTQIRSFWITNSLALKASPALIAALRERPEVSVIQYDEQVRFNPGESAADGDRVAGWNMALTRVDEVWTGYGLSGSGIVIGSMDTGVDLNHPALAGKWRGGANSWMDIINGLAAPYDDHGHGTHTIGTLVGGDGPGPFADDIGVAYGAQFICAKVLDQNNSFSSASIVIAGAQWMLDPDGNPATNDFPNVINNSWGFFSQTYSGFFSTVNTWRVAGIIPVFSLGNNGPAAATTGPPGNYANTIGVGATTVSDVVASFSSRGPSPSGASFPADLRKPNVSAPGASVRSSVPGGGYANWSGTSMASPLVAGTVALLLQRDPSLDYQAVLDALVQGAMDIDSPGYDHNTGYGRVDAFAAVSSLPANSYALWIASFGIAGPAAAFDFDADSDGVDNGAEYAAGTIPTDITSVAPLAIALVEENVAVSLTRNTDATDVVIRLQRGTVAGPLPNWTDLATCSAGTWTPAGIVNESGMGNPVQAGVVETAAGTPQAFYRLVVALPSP